MCGASREDVYAVLDELALVGKRVELMIRIRPMLPDPNDEMVLETAINGRADAIVTFNERDFRSEGGALVLRGGPISRLLRHSCPNLPSPRPEPWLPYVFTSIDDPRLNEFVTSLEFVEARQAVSKSST